MTNTIPSNTGLNGANNFPIRELRFSPQPQRIGRKPAINFGNTDNSQMPPVASEIKYPDGTIIRTFSNGSYKISRYDEAGNLHTTHYNSQGQFTSEYTSENGKSIGKDYDQNGRVTCLHVKEQDKNGKTIVDKFTNYEYGDDGNVRSETVYDCMTSEITTLKYDENGNRTEKFVKKGAVTTYYDAEDKPVRRETNKGAGIIVTEDLTE